MQEMGLLSPEFQVRGESLPERKMLVVAPGATTSTFDIFVYTLEAFREETEWETVRGFYLHNSIAYHYNALEIAFPDWKSVDRTMTAQVRATMDVLFDIIMQEPDFVHIIDGTGLPQQFYDKLFKWRLETGRRFIVSVHLTEEPYASDYTRQLLNSVDVAFVNDRDTADSLDPGHKRHIYYVPHVYHPKVHYPGFEEEKDIDVFFCGTLYPERIKFLSEIDWTGINAKIVSHYTAEELPKSLLGVFHKETMSNSDVADHYRRCKIAMNLHRTVLIGGEGHIDASIPYSANPRTIEAAACGAFQVSDIRREIVDVFGDSIAMAETPKEFEYLMRKYLNEDEERTRLAIKANKIVEPYSSEARARFMLSVMEAAYQSMPQQRFGGYNED